jgi:hypothetical protein
MKLSKTLLLSLMLEGNCGMIQMGDYMFVHNRLEIKVTNLLEGGPPSFLFALSVMCFTFLFFLLLYIEGKQMNKGVVSNEIISAKTTWCLGNDYYPFLA